MKPAPLGRVVFCVLAGRPDTQKPRACFAPVFDERDDVDFHQRTVTYYGCNGESYAERYPAVEIS